MLRISGWFGALILTIGLVSCGGGGDLTGTTGGGGGGGGGCPAATFCMLSSSFSPTTRTVTVGTTVTWRNDALITHNVTWDAAAGRNAALAGDGTGDIVDFSSGSHTRLFNTAGTYAFHCTIHAGMIGSLTVQ
jgi:plastocyanin